MMDSSILALSADAGVDERLYTYKLKQTDK